MLADNFGSNFDFPGSFDYLYFMPSSAEGPAYKVRVWIRMFAINSDSKRNAESGYYGRP